MNSRQERILLAEQQEQRQSQYRQLIDSAIGQDNRFERPNKRPQKDTLIQKRKKKRGGIKLKEKKNAYELKNSGLSLNVDVVDFHALEIEKDNNHSRDTIDVDTQCVIKETVVPVEELVEPVELIDVEKIEEEEEVNMLEGIITKKSIIHTESNALMGIPSWLTNPLLISSKMSQSSSTLISKFKLPTNVQTQLSSQNITHLFPVQEACLNALLPTIRTTLQPSDIFVHAQTGSGKTLAYILPILSSLHARVVRRLRALVIVPTRDLMVQVKNEFDHYCKGSNLVSGLIPSQANTKQYKRELVDDKGEEIDDKNEDFDNENDDKNSIQGAQEFDCGFDIGICTPGSICASIKAGLIVTDLRFLVIDEADRLLNQTYQHWLEILLGACCTKDQKQRMNSNGLPNKEQTTRITRSNQHGTPLQKMLFSATLTKNPMKISMLDLNDPTYICVASSEKANASQMKSIRNEDTLTDRIILPDTLRESMIITTIKNKLSVLTHILTSTESSGTLIFTKSISAAHRLSAFLNIHLPKHSSSITQTIALSSSLTQKARQKVLNNFKNINILVCSDVLSRGIDMQSQVSLVINYDVPLRVATYVHRCGRTARAGNQGHALTFLERNKVKHFKEVLRACDRVHGVGKMVVSEGDSDRCAVGMEESLQVLESMVNGKERVFDDHEDYQKDDRKDDQKEANDFRAYDEYGQ